MSNSISRPPERLNTSREGDSTGRPTRRSSFLSFPMQPFFQPSESGTRGSDNVTGAAGQFQHRTGHPLRSPAILLDTDALAVAFRFV